MSLNTIAKWVAAAAIGGSVLALELLGKAPAGTFINMIAMPAMVALGTHTVAKTLN